MDITGTFYFDPSDKIYHDHFPGCPVVPGSLIISAFMEAIRQEEINGSFLSVEDFRFKEFIQPGEYGFRVKDKNGKLICGLYLLKGEKKKALVTGIIASQMNESKF